MSNEECNYVSYDSETYNFKLGNHDCSIIIEEDEITFHCSEEGNMSNPFVFKRKNKFENSKEPEKPKTTQEYFNECLTRWSRHG